MNISLADIEMYIKNIKHFSQELQKVNGELSVELYDLQIRHETFWDELKKYGKDIMNVC